MTLEHDNPVEREYGPDPGLFRRRIYGGIIIAGVLAFLAVVVTVFGNGDGEWVQTFYGPVPAEKKDILPFILKASGLAGVALLVPWLATRSNKD